MSPDPRSERAAYFAHFVETGCHAAFHAFAHEVTPVLMRFATLRTNDLDEAEDLVQLTYVTALRKVGSFIRGRDPLPWLIGILATHARSSWRRQARRARPGWPAGGDEPPVDEVVARRELVAELMRAVDALPYTSRDVVLLHVRDGKSPLEIAEHLRRPRSTVRTQLARGLERLRAVLPRGVVPGTVAALLLESRAEALHARVLDGFSAPPSPLHAAASAPRQWLLLTAVLGLSAMLGLAWVAPGFLGGHVASDPTRHVPSNARVDVPAARSTPTSAPERDPVLALGAARATESPTHARQRVRLLLRATGQPVAGVSLRLFPRDGSKRPILDYHECGDVLEAATDDQGIATFTGPIPWTRAAVVFDDGTCSGEPFDLDADTIHEEHLDRVLRITGAVATPSRAPAAGARVFVSSNTAVGPGILLARTDSDGAFDATLANPGDRLVLWAECTCDAASRPLVYDRAAGHLRVRIDLLPGVPLRGCVLDDERRPIPGALIRIVPLGNGRRHFTSLTRSGTEHGTFDAHVAPWHSWGVVARARGFAAGCTVVRSPTDTDVVLVLDRGVRVEGSVTDHLGRSVGDRVSIVPKLPGANRPLLGALARTSDLAEGAFAIDDLPAGSLWAYVLQGNEILHAEELFAGSVGVTSWQPRLLPDDVLAGVLQDADGEPLAGVELGLIEADVVGPVGSARRKVTDDAGRFAFRGVRGDRQQIVVLGDPGSEPMPEWTVFSVHRGDVDLHLRVPRTAMPTATLQLEARTPADEPCRATLHLRAAGGRHSIMRAASSDGRLALSGLPGGRYEAVLSLATDASIHRRHLPPFELVPNTTLQLAPVALQPVAVVEPRVRVAGRLQVPRAAHAVRAGASLRGTPPFDAYRMEPDGRLVVDAGVFDLWLFGADFAPVRHGLDVAAGEHRDVVVDAAPAPTCRVRFHVDHLRNPMASGTVQLTILEGREEVFWMARGAAEDPIEVELGLAPGRYEVRAVADWGPRGAGELLVAEGVRTPSLDIDVR